MKDLFRAITITALLLDAHSLFAQLSKPMQVNVLGINYELILRDQTLTAKGGANEISGKLTKRLGIYSSWSFTINKNKHDGFELIINEKTNQILNQKNDLDAGGPFLEATTPDSKIVVFDYGTGSTERRLEMRNPDGKVLLQDTYLGEIRWTGAAFEYGIPQPLPIQTNAQTKECEEVGAAWSVQLHTFDGKEKKIVKKPPTIECSN